MLDKSKKSFYQFPSLESKSRQNPCVLCQSQEGSLVGKMNYIGLEKYQVLQCPDCGLIAFDPLPTSDIIAEGCSLLYQLQQSSESPKKILRGFSRSYRRGIRFARKYLKPILSPTPLAILEVGAGDGYFSEGVSKVYPGSKVTYVDVVEDLGKYYQAHFDCETYTGEFNAKVVPENSLDLIIIRDLLEHLKDPVEFLKDAYKSLKPGGLIFFITPNGREDIWPCFQRYKHTGEEYVIFLNHFYYYLPETLDRLLADTGFSKLRAFKFGLKHHRQGLGHKEIEEFPPQEIPEEPDHIEIKVSSEYWKHNPQEAKSGFLHNGGPLSKLYSALSDREKEIVDYYDPRGHEFFVLAQKR